MVLQAGDINTGACDQFRVLVPIARQHGAWVHVDGAFGFWAAASPRFAEAVRGCEQAHSWAVDGHKWLNVPYDCGYAFVADADAHRASMACHAAYVTHAAGGRDPLDWNPEWSRRARGFASYAALRHLGRNGVGGLVERCCDHARDLVAGIGRLPGAEILWPPTLNQGLVRFRRPGKGATERDHDERTNEVIDAIAASGEAFFSGTTWQGRKAMRVSVCSWRTTADDVDRTVRAIAAVLADLPRGGM